MNDRYAGDIGDFGKYGLLRALCGFPRDPKGRCLKLGIVWYLTPEDGGRRRDRIYDYLWKRPDLCDLDPNLRDSLRVLAERGPATVQRIEQSGACPPNTVHFDDCVPMDFHTSFPAERSQERQVWAERALDLMTECDLVFLDPDNGIVTDQRVEHHSKRGSMYVFVDEMRPYLARDQSLVVYHHTGRNGTADDQSDRTVSRLRTELGLRLRPLVLRYHRGTSRSYFIVPSASLLDLISERVTEFALRWKPHFTLGPGRA